MVEEIMWWFFDFEQILSDIVSLIKEWIEDIKIFFKQV